MSTGARRPDAGLWLDHASSTPLHVQVRHRLEELIRAGTWKQNHPIPSSRALAATLGVSRGTVITACQDLVAAGVLVSRPRSGLVVAGMSAAPSTSATVPALGARAPRRPDWSDLILPIGRGLGVGGAPVPSPDGFRYPFMSGQVETRGFPMRAWLNAMTSALDGPHLVASLRDAGEDDDDLLVEMIRTQVLPPRGIHATVSEIIVTAGTQQALSLIASSLLDAGRVVAFEEPGYLDARHLMQATGARVVPLPVDEEGAALAEEADCDLIYVTPSHQNPTNVSMSTRRRHDLLRRAADLDAIVVEDDFDSEMRYRGRPAPSLKSLDSQGRVIYVGDSPSCSHRACVWDSP